MPNNLERFVEAQERIYADALHEIRQGAKRTHWMWFVFPQIHGLGKSEMAKRFGISDLEEARAYVRHPVLGPRLHECTLAVLEGSAHPSDIFGSIDYQKFISCMTLFMLATDSGSVFSEALRSISAIDNHTLELLGEPHVKL